MDDNLGILRNELRRADNARRYFVSVFNVRRSVRQLFKAASHEQASLFIITIKKGMLEQR
jgi:hypothetical protein